MKPQHLSSDIISTLPPPIIEAILCLVPIEEAARTSVLSKEWRYKWTKIPKLYFDDYLFKVSSDDENDDENQESVSVSEQTMASERKNMGGRSKLFYAIYQVLLMRQGPIDEFHLHMDVDKTCTEIDHIISYLSRNNTLKKLTLHLYEDDGDFYCLPLSVFSFHHLTDLHLCDCDLNFQPTFSGFARLTSLCLNYVYISAETLLHLVSKPPLLKHFNLRLRREHLIGDVTATFIELFKCLPMMEHLCTYSGITDCFVIDSVPRELPTLLIHLKYFSMDFMSFSSANDLRFLALLIKSSPNLEKIMLEIYTGHDDDGKVYLIRKAYSDIWLEHLNELEILGYYNSKSELKFVKYILASAPTLKKVHLIFDDPIDKNEQSKMLRILLRSPPASPAVKIIVTSLHH